MTQEENEPKTMETVAASFADEVCEYVAKNPDDPEALKRRLQDIKYELVKAGAELEAGEGLLPIRDRAEFMWALAQKLPNFDSSALYHTRATVVSMAAAVLVGWLLGGLLSGLLNLIGMGGDILRAAAIFAAIWASEYLSVNPRARRILLLIFGLGGLARFAGMLAGGLVRFSGFGGLRQMIFGAARPNFFKGLWLMLGAVFLLIFFSRKTGSLDMAAFRASLAGQIGQSLSLVCFVLREVARRDEAIGQYAREKEKSPEMLARQEADANLRAALMSLLDSLDADKRLYLAEKLRRAGMDIQAPGDDYLVWNSKEDAAMYNTVGLVRDGDFCRILNRARMEDGRMVKGHVQRVEKRARQ